MKHTQGLRPRVAAVLVMLVSTLLAACSLSSTATPPSSETSTQIPASAVPTRAPTAVPTRVPTAMMSNVTPQSNASAPTNTGEQPTLITGTFTYTNDILTRYYVEHAVALTDMYGFVTRDKEWEIPVESQVLGFLKMDEAKQTGTFRLALPERPEGHLADVGRTGGAGVQVFAVGYSANITGGPFAEGDDRSRGWPSYLASTKNDSEQDDEVIGGKLVVWAPDAQQQFPTGYGADGKLFTTDDPVAPIPAGYSVIDLDQHPFGIDRQAQQTMTLYEPNDVAIKDVSKLSYTDAFEQMYARIRKEYAFNGIAGKQPDWDALHAQLAPRVADAQRNNDGKAFYEAIRDFTLAFRDGHVGLSGGTYSQSETSQTLSSGYGFAIRELDDGRVLVAYVTPNGPAAQAGITAGATVTQFNGQPIKDAIGAVRLFEPYSTDVSRRYAQAQYLLRAPVGSTATVTFANNGRASQTATVTAVSEFQSFRATWPYRTYDADALPVTFETLPSGVGYIKLSSFDDDLNLIIRLFERALRTFEANKVPGVIIDMRLNFGGSTLGLAGFLYDQEIELSQTEYFSEATGKFEPEGERGKITPSEHQYNVGKVVLLVDQACASACEIEAYAFSRVPGVVVVGQYPTAGVEAEVARGQFSLPDDLKLQVPTGREVLPDGSLFLEGEGVPPTVRVPITEETVLSQDDVVLQAGERAVLGR